MKIWKKWKSTPTFLHTVSQ